MYGVKQSGIFNESPEYGMAISPSFTGAYFAYFTKTAKDGKSPDTKKDNPMEDGLFCCAKFTSSSKESSLYVMVMSNESG